MAIEQTRFEVPTEGCSDCDGTGIEGFGGPGNGPCSPCRRTGRVVRQLRTEDVVDALNAALGYTPSGNRVLAQVAEILGIPDLKK